ncbi:MAG: hypothetical protein K6C97_12385 [Treponema sp.]|nr:hypothetical protein [Treponema sp.]
MAFNSISVHTNQISRLGLNQKVLKDGSSVLVRVIADKGNGKYTASVAGARVNLSSNKNLKVGSTFVANISAHDGKIFISPKENTGIDMTNVKMELLENTQLMNLLQKLGLPADSVALSLFQMTKQLEMKLDQGLLGKLHKIALKFSGKEKPAAEILLLLARKGLDIDEEELLQLLEFLDSNNSEDHSSQENTDKGKLLLNRINQREEGWFLFPFEIVEKESSFALGRGNIRLLPSHNQKPKIINLDCKYDDKSYLFNLSYDEGKLKKIKMFISEIKFDEIDAAVLSLKKRLIGLVSGIEIEWADREEIEGFASQGQDFYSFDGSV